MTGAELEGGVGGQIRGLGDGSGDRVPQKLEHLKKYTA